MATDTGTARFRSEAGGFWVIEMDDGRVFVPVLGLSIQFPADGERVTFTAKMRPDQASAHGQVIEITAIH